MTRTITRLYETYPQARDAIQALKRAQFTDQEISLVGHPGTAIDADTASSAGEGAATGAGIGGAVGAGSGLLAGLGMLAIPGIGPVVAAGWLATTAVVGLVGAAAGGAAGGIIGSLVADGTPEHDAHVYAEGIRRGGSLVTVRAPDGREQEATAILARYPAVDPSARGQEYRENGWQKFDHTATPYVPVASPPTIPPPAATIDTRAPLI